MTFFPKANSTSKFVFISPTSFSQKISFFSLPFFCSFPAKRHQRKRCPQLLSARTTRPNARPASTSKSTRSCMPTTSTPRWRSILVGMMSACPDSTNSSRYETFEFWSSVNLRFSILDPMFSSRLYFCRRNPPRKSLSTRKSSWSFRITAGDASCSKTSRSRGRTSGGPVSML